MASIVAKMVIAGGVLAVAIAATAVTILPQTHQSDQILISKGLLNELLKMNETERLVMFTPLTPEQEATLEMQREYCWSLAIDNNHTAILQSMSCGSDVGEHGWAIRTENFEEIHDIANQTIALTGRTYSQFMTDHIHQIYRDCLLNETDYYHYIDDEMVETCRNEILAFMREG